MDNVKSSLDQNQYLSQQVKENILELVTIFNSEFRGIDLSNFCEKLKTLQIKRISKFLNKDISMYDNNNNTIYFNLNELNKQYDMKHVLMYELLNVISSNGFQTGFNNDRKFESLNSGYTEMLTNLLVGNDSDISIFKEEAVYANFISMMIGVEPLQEAYFKNDSGIITKALERIGVK